MKLKMSLTQQIPIFLLLLICTNGWTNDFDDLEKKQTKEFVKNPFNSRNAVCVSTIKGMKTSEKWNFIGQSSYIQTFSGVGLSGKYKVAGNKLVINQEFSFIGGKKSSKKTFTLKYRLKKNPMKWQYIRKFKSGKQLYDCIWSL